MSAPRLAIEVQNVSGSNRIPPEQLLRSWALAAFTAPADSGAPDGTPPPPAGPGGGELTIRIVGERESADLNSRYRGKRGPTNVLAFMADLPPAPGEETVDGGRDAPPPPENRVAEQPIASDDAGNTRPRGTLSLRERDGNTLAAREGDAERTEAGGAPPAAGEDNTEQPARDGPPPPSDLLPLGDLVICAPVLAREAREQRKPFDAHWAHIVVHGVLHLLGYDHENESQADVMENRERKILAALGFQDPYSARG